MPSKRVAHLIVFLGGLWTLLPLYWMLNTAFKTWHEMQQLTPTLFPHAPSLEGFARAFSEGGKGIVDSTIIALGTMFVSLAIGGPAAYSFSRFGTGGRNLAFAVLVFRFMPPVVLAASFYLFAARLRIIDTHLLLILANSLVNIPFVAWIMKSFLDAIPYAIEEAAQMDGASWFQGIRHHVLPLARPGLVVVGLFVAIFTWNELFFALILTADDVVPFTRTINGLWVGRKYLLQPNWPAIAALGVLNVIAVFLLAFALHKHIVRVMTYGAVWGQD
jgi:multiple sugar transport system permease protein